MSPLLLLLICFTFLVGHSLQQKARHYKWDVEYMFWSPDCEERVVMGINGQFPGPTIRARAGDTVHIDLLNKLHTEVVGMHRHGLRQVFIFFMRLDNS